MNDSKIINWDVDNLSQIGGNKIEILGLPKVIEVPQGKAVEFDGKKDGIIVGVNPLAGCGKFTIEIIFRPDADGLPEQRFLHLQESDSENRILIETRLPNPKEWFFNTFIKSGETNQVLSAKNFLHPVGGWYHGALVFDGKTMRHYVNNNEEMSAEIAFLPPLPGKASVGMRINQISWFRGAIMKIRFTPEALSPKEFIKF